MDADVGAIITQARTAWPKIAIAEATFIAHLEQRAASFASFLDKVHGSDLYLACGVLHQDRAALTYFEEHFMARVQEYVLRIRAGRDVVDEVKQLLRERLIMNGKIGDYSGKGALGGWLRVAAVRTALNHLRASNSASSSEQLDEEISAAGDPELSYVKEHSRDLFADAFKRVLDKLDASERTILRLHYIDGLTMDQLAHLYKTPRSTIARRVADAREQVLASTQDLLREERRLSPSAIASVIRTARSQVQVTITRLFK